ncbi:MAG: pirin family protein [Mariniphaga sp.]|nr:pirin family protein [Mariniphaga sp.]
MKTIFHSSGSRGQADHGWLNAAHSFSFGNYYNNGRIHFGKLRVLNDDIIDPSMGFDIHPHQDMEIITIPLVGSLKHGDNMGHEEIISTGEVQVMSAGTGVWHSEHNASDIDKINLFQIWIFPDQKGHKSRYDQKRFISKGRKEEWQLLVSPDGQNESLWINQNAYIFLIESQGGKILYSLNSSENGVYFMMIEGSADIDGNKLKNRDALGMWEVDNSIEILFYGKSRLLAIEVPMN